MTTEKNKAAEVYDYMLEVGVPETAAKAMLANIAVESGYTFDSTIKQKGDRKDPAYGLFQFDPRGDGLDKPYRAYLKNKKKTDSMESQVEFFADTLYGDYKEGRKHIGYGNVSKFKRAVESGDLNKATEEFATRLLRPGQPHMERRLDAAQNLDEFLQKPVEPQGTAVPASAQIPLEGATGNFSHPVYTGAPVAEAASGAPLDPFRDSPFRMGKRMFDL